jgi:hypothetical protein
MVLPLLAQVAADLPPNVWQVVAQSGFNAILILILLYYGRLDLAELRKANERNITDLRRSQDRNTKMVTLALLQIASLVPGSRSQLESLKSEVEQAERDDHPNP